VPVAVDPLDGFPGELLAVLALPLTAGVVSVGAEFAGDDDIHDVDGAAFAPFTAGAATCCCAAAICPNRPYAIATNMEGIRRFIVVFLS
jgi:hypothetical protein